MIPFVCPHCEHRMELPDEFAGQRATCTRCGIPFGVPEGQAEEVNANVWADVYGHNSTISAGERAPADVGEARGAQTDDGPELPDWVEARHAASKGKLGAPFWTLAYFLPPVAFLWALALPLKHPQKKVALAMPFAWMAVLLSIGFAGAYFTDTFSDMFVTAEAVSEAPKTAPPAEQTPPAPKPGQRLLPGMPGYLDVMNLPAGSIYRVTKHDVPIHHYASAGGGIFGNLTMYELPVGGIFQVVNSSRVNSELWYQTLVTDGRNGYTMWINYKNIRLAGLEPVAPPSLTNPAPPVSTPIRRMY